jgi:AcrR family transcriptional regulator
VPTPRPRRADITQQILHHATRLFAARGFVGASLRDIARAVGIRKPSLLYHFPSKDELRQGVLEQMLAHWNDVVPNLLRAATSGEQQFEAVARETVDFFLADPDRARLLLREMLDRPAEMLPLVETHVQPWARIVCEYIRKGQAQGRVHRSVDPEAYVSNMINLVVCGVAMGETIAALTPGPDDDKQEAVRRHVLELLRIARFSLFIHSAADEAAEPATRDGDTAASA